MSWHCDKENFNTGIYWKFVIISGGFCEKKFQIELKFDEIEIHNGGSNPKIKNKNHSFS